jgi:hypothetical protein
MVVKFTKYRDGEAVGNFTPGGEIYIHSTEERDHGAIAGRKVKVYICVKAEDAEAAKANPNLEKDQAEEVMAGQMRLKTNLGLRDPIAITIERSVAEYWACVAATKDQRTHSETESRAVVLVLNGERLIELDHDLIDEQASWQNTIACWTDIYPLSDVLIRVEHVTRERYNELTREGPGAVSPAPPFAGIELTVMLDTISRLGDGDITPVGADAVVSTLAALRSAMS